MILLGDCLERMKELEENSIDAIVTDPPYGLKFMGKQWDYDVPKIEVWAEALRVLKPGGHLLSFFGTRTYHAGVIRIEAAGFEVRDMLSWIYGSGFPKSLDISKAIDKANGDFEKRPVHGKLKAPCSNVNKTVALGGSFQESPDITSAASAASAAWQGYGTALKPAQEPIVLARKPLSESTVAKNVLKWGVGGLNIDGCRISNDDLSQKQRSQKQRSQKQRSQKHQDGHTVTLNIPGHTQDMYSAQGRWPANVLLDEEAAAMLDEEAAAMLDEKADNLHRQQYETAKGGASRFFYVAKASKRERNAGLEGMPLKISGGMSGTLDGTLKTGSGNVRNNLNQNSHPTVKPIKLMEYLIKLITPPGGLVLDPFMGSGSTGVAAFRLGYKFIGIEMNAEYVEIAKKRMGGEEIA